MDCSGATLEAAEASGIERIPCTSSIDYPVGEEIPGELQKRFKESLYHRREATNSDSDIDTVSADIDKPTKFSTVPNSVFEELLNLKQKQRTDLFERVKELEIPYSNRVFKRLNYLEQATQEEYPFSELVSVDSLYGFLRFLKDFSNLKIKYPDITVTPSGNLRCQWQVDKAHYLSIEFLSVQDVKIVLFTPDRKVKGKTSRIASNISIASISENLSLDNVWPWITE